MTARLTWRQLLPITITLAAMMSGFFSILVTLESKGLDQEAAGALHRLAAQLIMLAMILDGLDGNVARRLGGCTAIGAELDTYVDMTAFGIAPAVLIYVVTLSGAPAWRVLMTSCVVLSGVLRLSRFKMQDPFRGQQGFSGLPITACAAWVAMFVFISQTQPYERFSLRHGPVALLFLTGIVAFIFLQVSMVRYPKPTKHPALFVPMVVMVCLLFIPLRFWRLSVYAAEVMVFLVGVYVVFGPVYSRRRAGRNATAMPEPAGSTPPPAGGQASGAEP